MTASPKHPPPGTVVGGRYRMDSVLGEGGFGVVYGATQLNLDRPVALKVLRPQGLTEEGLARFQREAAIFQQLEHPNVVRLLDFGNDGPGGSPYLVFELLRGRTLEATLRADGPLPVARIARVTTQILKALMEAHARGIVHRDVKPANVFLSDFQGEPDYVKVIDFGLAKGHGTRTLTQQGGVVGTVPYMAPEQVDGREVGFAADLFALGLTLSEMISGRPVMGGLELADVVNVLGGYTPIPHSIEALQSPLGPVIHRATQKSPQKRYASAAEMLAHLEAVVAQAHQAATQPPADPRAPAASVPTPLVVPVLAPHASDPHVPPTLQRAAAEPADTAPMLAVPLQTAPVVAPAPVVPPAPAVRARRAFPWGKLGLATLFAVLLGGAAVAAIALNGGVGRKDPAARPSASPSSRPPSSAPSPGPAPAAAVHWIGVRSDLEVVEIDARGDGGAVDFVAFCADETRARVGLCAVDGTTFQVIWRRPLTFDLLTDLHLGAVGRAVALVDLRGNVRVFEAATGAPQGASSLGARADRVCAPPELPGKLWIRLRERPPVAFDVGSRSLVDTPRPASCSRGPAEPRCIVLHHDPVSCPPEPGEPRTSDVSVHNVFVEGLNAVAIGSKKSDASIPMLMGFTPVLKGSAEPRLRWTRPLAPGDGLGAVRAIFSLSLVSGRAVTSYDHTSGKAHVVAVDAANGSTLWEVPTGPVASLHLTATRVYVQHREGLDVRDAATGKLLGSVGSVGKQD